MWILLVNMMLERKMKAEEISELSGVTRRTLSGWVKIADEEGFDALRGKERTGRSSKLSKEQKEEIKNALIYSRLKTFRNCLVSLLKRI